MHHEAGDSEGKCAQAWTPALRVLGEARGCCPIFVEWAKEIVERAEGSTPLAPRQCSVSSQKSRACYELKAKAFWQSLSEVGPTAPSDWSLPHKELVDTRAPSPDSRSP